MDTTYRIICALCIIFLRFPLYYLAPIKVASYTDVMNSDTGLCNNSIKQFLSKSEYTKECSTLIYPQDIKNLTLKTQTIETFLCLGMYDTTYKVCQYVTHKKWTNTFSKREDLDSSIQTITGFKPNGEDTSPNLKSDENNFCKLLSGYKPMYGTVQPVLLILAESLKDPLNCNKICIDFDKKVNPLCVLLAWTTWLDQTVINNTVATSTSELEKQRNDNSNIPKPVKDQEMSITEDKDHHKQSADIVDKQSPLNIAKDDTAKETTQSTKPKDSNSQPPNISVNSATNDAPREGSSLVDKQHDKNNLPKSSTTSQTSASKPVKTPDTPQIKPEENSQQLDRTITDIQQLPKNVKPENNVIENNKNSDTHKIVNDKTTSSQAEEIKSTTLSENTQDNAIESNAANNPYPDEFSPDEDQLSNNLNDGLSQPIDAVDGQNDNIPDTSGQREMENIRVIKNEEESHFFTYFAITSLGFIAGYIAYHNKQKILAIVLEGRRSKNNRSRRRPSTANYRKLDCTLEEAVTSQCNANVTHVIY